MKVTKAIKEADSILPGLPSPNGQEDPRWQAIIGVGEYVGTAPDAVWDFVARWGKHPSKDLRTAIATCLIEHLLEHHFALIFPRVEHLALSSRRFADTFTFCAKFGQAEKPSNSARFNRLLRKLRRAS